MIKEEIRNIGNSAPELRRFGISVGTVLVIIGSVMFLLDINGFIYFTIAGTILVFSGIVFPAVLKPLNLAWMSLAILLGFVMTRVILIILYYLVLTPVALLAKITGKKFLEKRFDKNIKTYWNYRDKKEIVPTDYERQF